MRWFGVASWIGVGQLRRFMGFLPGGDPMSLHMGFPWLIHGVIQGGFVGDSGQVHGFRGDTGWRPNEPCDGVAFDELRHVQPNQRITTAKALLC